MLQGHGGHWCHGDCIWRAGTCERGGFGGEPNGDNCFFIFLNLVLLFFYLFWIFFIAYRYVTVFVTCTDGHAKRGGIGYSSVFSLNALVEGGRPNDDEG